MMFSRSRRERFLWKLVVFFLFAVVPPQWSSAAAQSPMSVIQAGTDKAIGILHASNSGQAPALRQRKGEILVIVDEYFNFEEMAKRALGRPWKDQPTEKRLEFVKLFKQLLFNTYINRVESYTGANEKIAYDSEKIDGDYAVVKSHVTYQGNQNVQIDYRLHQENGQWKVYDVVVEGISFVDNYRGQFASILANGSFDSLLKKIREKVDQSSNS
jgi:phospholipid transport system substrate-binding protein